MWFLPSWSPQAAGKDDSDLGSTRVTRISKACPEAWETPPKEMAFKLIPTDKLLRGRIVRANGKACSEGMNDQVAFEQKR